MKKWTTALGALILFIACNSGIQFGKTQHYLPAKHEKEISYNQDIVNHYEHVINIDTLNVPLNKFIQGKGYKVYIGVSLVQKPAELFDTYKQFPEYTIYKKRNNKGRHAMLFAKDKGFYYTHSYHSPKDDLTYILTMEADSATVGKHYKQQLFTKKTRNE